MKDKRPWWLAVVIIVVMSPILMFPALLGQAPDGGLARMLVWFYPAYVIAAGICAWLCWPQRKELTWILLVLMALTHLGMYILITTP